MHPRLPCQNNPDLFFAENQNPAVKLCGPCPIREACFKQSIDNKEVYGTWGGMNEEMRRQRLVLFGFQPTNAQMNRAACIKCGLRAKKLDIREVQGTARWGAHRASCGECGYDFPISAAFVEAVKYQRAKKDKRGYPKSRETRVCITCETAVSISQYDAPKAVKCTPCKQARTRALYQEKKANA